VVNPSPENAPGAGLGAVYVFPTSYGQRSLWFLDQFAPGNSRYNLSIAIRFRSPLNIAALEQSIGEIVRRHESLRTAFATVDGEPVQVVAPALHVPLQTTDLGSLAPDQREAEMLAVAAKEADRTFNLSRWPLLHPHLLRLAEDDHVLILTMHHIVVDFWSLNLLEHELATLYERFSAGLSSSLPEPGLQFADYAAWERQLVEGATGQAQLEFWKKQLADVPTLRMPTDWPRPRRPTFAGADYHFSLPRSVYAGLVELGRQENATLFMTTLAAFQVLLHRYSGQDDIVVGTPVANRGRPELERVVGYFVNSLVLRTDVSEGSTFRQLLSRVRSIALEAFAHQELPFERLVAELNAHRDYASNPLFQVHFQLLADGVSELSDDESTLLGGEYLEIETHAVKFDLALDLWDASDSLWGRLEYSTELFSHGTAARMMAHYQNILAAVGANPDQHIADLRLQGENELETIITEWNSTATDRAKDTCLHQLVEEQAQRTPEAVALEFRGEELTYAALNARANQLAHHLRSLGIGPEAIVGVYARRSIEMVVGILGILKAGAGYLPLDPADPVARLRLIVEGAQPAAVLTQAALLDRSRESTSCRLLCLDSDWETVTRCSTDNLAPVGNACNLAYVIFTSGSSGIPKGVLTESRAVCNHLLWMQSVVPLGPGDRTLLKYPFNFDASVCEIFCPLIAGARLIVTEPEEHWNASHFVRVLKQNAISVLDVVPSMLEVLLDEPAFAECTSLRRVICGGEELTASIRDRFFGQMHAELYNIYGPTEATIGATAARCEPDDIGQPVNIGKPIANTQVYILDARLKPVPIGVAGELCIGGDCLARGYLNDPIATAEAFVPNPFSEDGARLYRTGDLARFLPDGSISYLGRMDKQVKVRGHRLELAEVEGALAQHPRVRACAVVPIERAGGTQRLTAYVVAARDEPQLWPSVGEYDVYDAVLYHAMSHDERRNRAYQAAIRRTVNGKVVLDVGTGADALLARFCIDAGAKRVYAIESDQEAFQHAIHLVDSLGLTGRVIVVNADSRVVTLPEPVEVCVSEIIGTIGSSEGAVEVLNDARRFLRPDGVMIPQSCTTLFAPVSVPASVVGAAAFTDLPRLYVDQVFARIGHPFDLRLCVKNLPEECLLAEPGVFEQLDFRASMDSERQSAATFVIGRDAVMHGFVLWINLFPDEHEILDSLRTGLSWLPVYFPAFHPGLQVSKGDVIRAHCSARLGSDARMPDYSIHGSVLRQHGEALDFVYDSPYRSSSYRANPFYASLFRNGPMSAGLPFGQAGPDLVPDLRRYLRTQLPEYALPASFVLLDRLPLTATGKLDQNALPRPTGTTEAAFVAPHSDLEKLISDIWSGVLDMDELGAQSNFFDLGGNSLLITQVRSRLESALSRDISVMDLFQYPTISALARFLDDGEPESGLLEAAAERVRKQLEVVGTQRQQRSQMQVSGWGR
jgi:amino acid adenylation domain-containing protein